MNLKLDFKKYFFLKLTYSRYKNNCTYYDIKNKKVSVSNTVSENTNFTV